jgi:hypothetical protein
MGSVFFAVAFEGTGVVPAGAAFSTPGLGTGMVPGEVCE